MLHKVPSKVSPASNLRGKSLTMTPRVSDVQSSSKSSARLAVKHRHGDVPGPTAGSRGEKKSAASTSVEVRSSELDGILG